MSKYKILSDLCFFYSELVYSSKNKVEIRVYKNRKPYHLFDIIINPDISKFTLKIKDKDSMEIEQLQNYCSTALALVCNYCQMSIEQGLEKYWFESKVQPLMDFLNDHQYDAYLIELSKMLKISKEDPIKNTDSNELNKNVTKGS